MLFKSNRPNPAFAATLFALLSIGPPAEAGESRAKQIQVAGEELLADEAKARGLFARIEELVPLNRDGKKAYADLEAQIKQLQSRLDAANAQSVMSGSSEPYALARRAIAPRLVAAGAPDDVVRRFLDVDEVIGWSIGLDIALDLLEQGAMDECGRD